MLARVVAASFIPFEQPDVIPMTTKTTTSKPTSTRRSRDVGPLRVLSVAAERLTALKWTPISRPQNRLYKVECFLVGRAACGTWLV